MLKIGTRSILVGAHQFLIHPLFVAYGWTKLYGFPKDYRLWVAFYVHDLGYWGLPNMDGPEGEKHVEFGANLMHRLFDKEKYEYISVPFEGLQVYVEAGFSYDPEANDRDWLCGFIAMRRSLGRSHEWRDLCLYHSRFYAKLHNKPFSRLCVADKLVPALMPKWFYIFQVWLSGEIKEYMSVCDSKYVNEVAVPETASQWYDNMTEYMGRWAQEHKDCRADTWTKR